ncbi:hypothetical protein [Flagellimonas flava]|uniref:Right handed beta helix region n=1 Tax=Flagellimonas flava TaxID=570519 RepID=A0A1M5L1X6_9FLAO|nr:hypothetical protein [Allomuricauda flava]SHG58930.1 hypothetical protein SAMN04488116_1907 [Allomuricauda flava]
MQIKKVKNSRNRILAASLVLVSLLLVGLIVKKNEAPNKNSNAKGKLDIEAPTTVVGKYSIYDMIKNDVNKVHSDSIISLYFNTSFGVPKLYYVYKDSLTYKERTDRFFLHVYPKEPNTLLTLQKHNFVNLDFSDPNPIELNIDGDKFFMFKRVFIHEELGDFLALDNIDFINTGRYVGGQGRSYEASGVKLKNLTPINITNSLEKLTISLSQKNYDKIKQRRDEALKSRVLVKKDDDFVKAGVAFNNSEGIKAALRLKGDWTDHLNDEKKWSYRIILEEDKSVMGMNKFSIQHPKVRNYEWEWLFHKIIKQNDIIGLRYDFLNVFLEIDDKDSTKTKSLGIMAIEESFTKRLVENNKRREGIILSFEESQIWDDRKKQFDLMLEEDSRSAVLQSIQNAPLKLFEETKVLADPKLSKQFRTAQNLLEGLRHKKLKITEVFDVDKLTTFVALSNLFGGQHGLIDHNLKFYFNPITNKLEPIAFDSHSGFKIRQFVDYPFSEGDDLYTQKLNEKLELFTRPDFIYGVLKDFGEELNRLFADLSIELKTMVDPAILDYNSNFIKKRINPSNTIVSNLLDYRPGTIQVAIANLSDLPVEIYGIDHSNGRSLSAPFQSNPVIPPNQKRIISFPLKDAFENAFVSKKNKKGGFRFPKDVKKLKIKHKLLGTSLVKADAIIPFGLDDRSFTQNVVDYKNSFVGNCGDFPFIKVMEDQKKIVLQRGEHTLSETLVIPKNYNVTIEDGFSLDLVNGASFISNSPIICRGSKTSPIRFFSTNSSGAGIFVSGTGEKSVLNHCYFTNLSNPTSPIWELSGAVNFHEAPVEITNSVFEKNRCEDALNIIRSNFTMDSSFFKETFSDAFDGDFVVGSITNCQFLNSGNDGIDVSGSNLELDNIHIGNSSDKALSAGESSVVTGSNINVEGGEIGIVSKDLSSISLSSVKIMNTKLGLSSFQKKSEYGTGHISVTGLTLINCQLDYLIENGSELLVDAVPVETVTNSVLDQMYGKEYGKSSK